jgi:hypothetical protein
MSDYRDANLGGGHLVSVPIIGGRDAVIGSVSIPRSLMLALAACFRNGQRVELHGVVANGELKEVTFLAMQENVDA